MELAGILNQIDLGNYALPVFQRGYVWNREQVRKLMYSLYRGYPIGSLLIWTTTLDTEIIRGDVPQHHGTVNLILDGQQRITSLYGIIRGTPPPFFEGDSKAFTNLYFNVETEVFEFYAPMKMDADKNWISVTELMQEDAGNFVQKRNEYINYLSKLNAICNIKKVVLPIQQVSGNDKSIDVVVEIFNNVNSGGTKLSKGDLALAKLCAQWPEARNEMNAILRHFKERGFTFSMDWLLRCITVYLTGQPYFSFLTNVDTKSFKNSLPATKNMVGNILDQIGSKLGLDHDRVLAGKFTIPIIIHMIKQAGSRSLDYHTWNKILYWYIHAFLWGRYSASTESALAQDLNVLNDGQGVEGLIGILRKSRGDLTIHPADFLSWSVGSRFYPLLYLLTRMSGSVDWMTGVELSSSLLGKHSSLEVHHIFPRKLLYDAGYDKAEVNTLANFTFLTKDTNLAISSKAPKVYMPEVLKKHPDALSTHWIPLDERLWEVDNYLEFTAKRRELLAAKANDFLDKLYKSDIETKVAIPTEIITKYPIDISYSEEEEELLLDVLSWLEDNGLPLGELNYEVINESGEVQAIFDIAWPEGIQSGLSEPLALLLDGPARVYEVANRYNYKYFTDIEEFKVFVQQEYID